MLEEKLPKLKYNLLDYPNLEERADGMCIPLLWGRKENITPVLVNKTTGLYKISMMDLKSFDAIRIDGVLQEAGAYAPDLLNGELIILNAPYVNAGSTYYVVLEGTFIINGTHYLLFGGDNSAPFGHYLDGKRYEIDQFGAWTMYNTKDIFFEVWGKDNLGANEELKINFPYDGSYGSYIGFNFRDVVARTRVAQSIGAPSNFYITKIKFWTAFYSATPPDGNVRLAVLSAYTPAEVQVGRKSNWKIAIDTNGSLTGDRFFYFQVIPEKSKISIDASGKTNPDTTLMTNVADILQFIYVDLLKGDPADLDAADFAALKAARPEELAIWLDKETRFGEIKERLEAGQLFQFIQNLTGGYTVKYYEAGEPPGTPHYRDEDFVSFEAYRNLSSVYQKTKVKYDENPSTQEWKIEEATSEIARFFYRSKRTLEIETYHKNGADALQLAKDYLGTDITSSRKVHLQVPQRTIKFELQKGLGFSLMPTQKVKITRSRGDYSGGSYSAVLFRIIEIEKKYNAQTVEITAALDSLTY